MLIVDKQQVKCAMGTKDRIAPRMGTALYLLGLVERQEDLLKGTKLSKRKCSNGGNSV